MYILQEREFVKTNQEIYKIGTTASVGNRMKQYPKGSKIIAIFPVSINPEQIIINKFKILFKQRQDIGIEYFEGKIDEIIKNMLVNCYC